MVAHLLEIVLLCNIFFHVSCLNINRSKLAYNEGFNTLYGESNIYPVENNKSVQIIMDERTSSGFHSKLMYTHGYFETSLKLPENYTAGVVVTFYMCNSHKYPYHRDEIDFEFLGHVDGQKWVVQTNFYGNGSTSRGREERYEMWFDPSEDFHRYGILLADNRVTYYVDSIPIRHVKRVNAMSGDFPSKEMSLIATIWDGSNWATNGGKSKLDLSYAPYVAKYTGFVMNGCPFGQAQSPAQTQAQCDDFLSSIGISNELTQKETGQMVGFRRKFMTYSYCYDKRRYAVPLPECVFNLQELQHLQKIDPWTFGSAYRVQKYRK